MVTTQRAATSVLTSRENRTSRPVNGARMRRPRMILGAKAMTISARTSTT